MTGAELFNVYRRKLEELGVGMDEWVELEPNDRHAWNATAAEVFGRSEHEDMGG